MQDARDIVDQVDDEHPDNEHPDNDQGPLSNMQNRVYSSVFERFSYSYSSAVPPECRKALEYILLAFAFLPLFTLIYIHINFVQTPVNCLAHVSNNWPRDGILRVELRFGEPEAYSGDPFSMCYPGIKMYDFKRFPSNTTDSVLSNPSCSAETAAYFQDHQAFGYPKNSSAYSPAVYDLTFDVNLRTASAWPQRLYIIEYTLEYGFMKLSDASREKLNIPILVVVLDPHDEKCFGNKLSQFLLRYIVGYSDVLMSSLKSLVDKDETKGFVRNVVSGDQYRFVNKTLTWTSYVVAGLIMMAFTLTISMLLRYSHYQVFHFLVQMLHMLEFNVDATFPAASILTVVFALIGLEAIMSEFFNDSKTALYVIFIVWCADQYDSVCCRHIVTRRHWLRFFYLYHFAFYAYDHRFNGQYTLLALFTSWMFIQHSMIYFFHRFELPSTAPRVESDASDSAIQAHPNHSSPSSLASSETFSRAESGSSNVDTSHVSSEFDESAISPQLPEQVTEEILMDNEDGIQQRGSAVPAVACQKYCIDESSCSDNSTTKSFFVETLEIGVSPESTKQQCFAVEHE